MARAARWLIGAVCAALLAALLATALLVLAGYRPTTDRSNSMAPSIHRGDVLFSRSISASQARVGDVITFADPYFRGVLLTHRVRAERRLAGGRIAFTTRGDANTGSEHWTIAADGRITRVSFRVPAVGHAFIALDGHPLYVAAALVLALWSAVLAFVWRRTTPRRRRRQVALRRLVRRVRELPLVALAALAVGVPGASAAAGYALAAGGAPAPSVTLVVNDQGAPLFQLTAMRPGEIDSACELVTNEGPAAADVGVYDGIAGSGLERYLTLTVYRGTLPGDAPTGSCEGFAPDGADYAGDGAGVIYQGPLDGFPSTGESALADPGNPWPAGSSVAYRMVVALAGGNAAQGLSATQTFYFGAAGAGSSGDGGGGGGGSASPPGGGATPIAATTTTSTSAGAAAAPSSPTIGAVTTSASKGTLVAKFPVSGQGRLSAVAKLVWKVRVRAKPAGHGPVKLVTKTRRTPLGSGQAIANASGRMRIVIHPLRRSLALYRRSPHRYRVSVTITASVPGATARTRTVWVKPRSVGLLARQAAAAARKRT